MGRSSGLTFGLLGIILPGYLIYSKIKFEFLGEYISRTIISISITGQGFFYRIIYSNNWGGALYIWWLKSPYGGNPELYIFLVRFGLAILGFLAYFRNSKEGAYLLLLAGITNLAVLLLTYSNIAEQSLQYEATVYPIPVGAIFLLLAGLLGLRD